MLRCLNDANITQIYEYTQKFTQNTQNLPNFGVVDGRNISFFLNRGKLYIFMKKAIVKQHSTGNLFKTK